MWAISWTYFPSPHSLVHGQRWCVQFWNACLWSGECQISWSCCISWSAIEYGRCMEGAPPTHHLLCLSLPSGQTLHGHCATPHQTIGLWVLALVHECVIINLCKEILLAYSANKVGEGLLKMRGCCIWGQRSESHVDSLKTVLDIMQDEGSLDSSHGPHTCLLPS